MLSYYELKKMSNEELLEKMADQGGAPVSSVSGGEQLRNREVIRTILDYRNAKELKRYNDKLFWLTVTISILTFILTVKTFLD